MAASDLRAPSQAVRRSLLVQVPVMDPVAPAATWAKSATVQTPSPVSRRSVKLVGGVHVPPDQLVPDQIRRVSATVVVSETAGVTVPLVAPLSAELVTSQGSPEPTAPV